MECVFFVVNDCPNKQGTVTTDNLIRFITAFETGLLVTVQLVLSRISSIFQHKYSLNTIDLEYKRVRI